MRLDDFVLLLEDLKVVLTQRHYVHIDAFVIDLLVFVQLRELVLVLVSILAQTVSRPI